MSEMCIRDRLVLGAKCPVLALVEVMVGVLDPGDVGSLVEAAVDPAVVPRLAPAQGRVIAGGAQMQVVVVDLDADVYKRQVRTMVSMRWPER